MRIKSSVASSDLALRGMWLRMWSSMSSAMRLLMAPLAPAKRWRTSAHDSSSVSARRTDSSWPMTFLVRVTKSNFSREVCDILLDYLGGVCYQTQGPYSRAPTIIWKPSFKNQSLRVDVASRGPTKSGRKIRRFSPLSRSLSWNQQ